MAYRSGLYGNNSVLIELSDLYNQFPTTGYVESIFLYNTRVHRIGTFEEISILDKKYKPVIETEFYDEWPVQIVYFDKYRLTFLKTESDNSELIKYAKNVTITDNLTSREIHAKKIEYSVEYEQDLQKVTIEFIDVNPDNYPAGLPVINRMRSDVIKLQYSQTLLVQVHINVPVSAAYNFFTLIPIIEVESDPYDLKETDLNGRIKTAQVITKTQKEVILFLNATDLQLFKENAPICTESGNMTIFYNSTTYSIIERPDFEVNEISGAIDLYKVTLKATTTINNTKKYT